MPPSRLLVVAALLATAFVASAARADDQALPNPDTAGYHNGLFFIRDRSDAFRFYAQGRVHADGVTWLGPGVGSLGPDAALKSTFFLRRARIEIGGEFFHHWQWELSGDFAPTSTDNSAGTTDSPSCSVNATTGADSCSNKTNPIEAPLQKPGLTDAFINYARSSWFNLQIGQYLLPFTMEARNSDNTTPFLERSVVARDVGAPNTRDIGAMVWGEDRRARVYYTLGIYDGDGPNRTNADSRFDYVGRAFVRPLQSVKLMRDTQLGISGRYGTRDPTKVGYDMPQLTTQEGFVFWKPTYKDSLGRTLHIIPSAEESAVGFDVYVPVDGFDFTGEFVYAWNNTREAVDGYQLSPFTERTGTLNGYAYYLQVGAWLMGSRDIIGPPSYGKPLHADLDVAAKKPRQGLQALVKFEQLHLTYDGAARGGRADLLTPNGDIDMLSVSFGLNYWATRHLRVGLNWMHYAFPDSAPVTPSTPGGPQQTPGGGRALAPAQYLAAGTDNTARDFGHTVEEIAIRVGVQF